MSGLVEVLRALVVRGELDLSELDEVYRDPESGEALRIPFRLNWTRGQKERQRALQQETVDLQRRYVRLRELVGKAEKWQAAKDEADGAAAANWRHWAEWWSGILLMEVEEVMALADALPEQHWMWVTREVGVRAGAYEGAALKKADG